MRNDSDRLLAEAIRELRTSKLTPDQFVSSARHIAERLGIDPIHQFDGLASGVTINDCETVRQLLPPFRSGNTTETQSLFIRSHLLDCGACHRAYSAGENASRLDWSAPKVDRLSTWRPRAFGWVMAPAFALLVSFFFLYRTFWQVPPGVRAAVQSVDGPAYLSSSKGDRALTAGDTLKEGDELRTSGGAHAVLRLTDGSTIEVNERSVVGVGARGRDTTIGLENGAVIVQAMHRSSGHLYVRTADCRVAVTGTVFSVNAGIKGSRVAVLQGSLHVMHAGTDTYVLAGDQVATNRNLSAQPVAQQIAWSRDRDKYLLLLTQLNLLQHKIDQIPSPGLRYSSDLLPRVPANTLLYISVPNYGDFLGEANAVFREQLKESPALQQWWQSGEAGNRQQLDTLIDRLQQISGYLGDEVVLVGLDPDPKNSNSPAVALVADVKKSGLDSFLENQMAGTGVNLPLRVFNEASLSAASVLAQPQTGGYALVLQHEIVISNSVALLKQMNAQLNTGASGFATGDFGQQIASAYQRGAGVILAADVRQMISSKSNSGTSQEAMENTGLNGVQYLIAEHREVNRIPENHLNLQFSGSRQGVASWLAAPAPIGSLDFVTPNASLTVALLSKDPSAIAEDIMSMADRNAGPDNADANYADKEIRNDLAANLGGDFLLSLDGAVLPTPAWKAVIEVHDSVQFEETIEHLVEVIRQRQTTKQAHEVSITTSELNGQRFYAIQDVVSGSILAQYTFADGYMILAPDRALLMQAIHAHTSGDSLARSASFKALLPQDENANYSAVAYQNLGPVLSPLLSHLSGDLANAVSQMAADARPTAVCAWGKDNRIEAASNSRLFGFDFLTLQALLRSSTHPGNKHGDTSVDE